MQATENKTRNSNLANELIVKYFVETYRFEL